jgi:hypothetical protein
LRGSGEFVAKSAILLAKQNHIVLSQDNFYQIGICMFHKRYPF